MDDSVKEFVLELMLNDASVMSIRDAVFEKFGVRLLPAEIRRVYEENADSIREHQQKLTEEAYQSLSLEGLLRRVHRVISDAERRGVRLDYIMVALRFAQDLSEAYYKRQVAKAEEDERIRKALEELGYELQRNRELLENAERAGLVALPPELKRFQNLIIGGAENAVEEKHERQGDGK